jgi:hypothetical protein
MTGRSRWPAPRSLLLQQSLDCTANQRYNHSVTSASFVPGEQEHGEAALVLDQATWRPACAEPARTTGRQAASPAAAAESPNAAIQTCSSR